MLLNNSTTTQRRNPNEENEMTTTTTNDDTRNDDGSGENCKCNDNDCSDCELNEACGECDECDAGIRCRELPAVENECDNCGEDADDCDCCGTSDELCLDCKCGETTPPNRRRIRTENDEKVRRLLSRVFDTMEGQGHELARGAVLAVVDYYEKLGKEDAEDIVETLGCDLDDNEGEFTDNCQCFSCGVDTGDGPLHTTHHHTCRI